MKKIFTLLAIVTLLVSIIPGVATATTYNNDTPSGVTLLAWSTTSNQGGKDTMINFLYSTGFRSSMEIHAPFDTSWHSLDDVRPILLAQQEGYGNYLGGTNGALGSNIKFSDNVLVAMKVQNFNPSQVGGADIPLSSTTINSDQTAWLQKIGYSINITSSTSTTSPPTHAPAPTSQTQTTQSQPKPSPPKVTSTHINTTTASQQSNNNISSTNTSSNPAVGQSVKTPSGPITPEMAVADQKMATQNPPSLNPANIPIKVPVKKETNLTRDLWIWIAGGSVILILAVVAGWIIYIKNRTA